MQNTTKTKIFKKSVLYDKAIIKESTMCVHVCVCVCKCVCVCMVSNDVYFTHDAALKWGDEYVL